MRGVICHPDWRCLRFGCPRCDRQRRRDAARKLVIRDFVDAFSGVDPDLELRFRNPTAAERRRELEALRRSAEQERERRESDTTLN